MRLFLKSVSVVAYVLLVGLFLAGYVARYVHPRHFWWIQLVAVFLPYLSGLVLLAGIPLLLKRRWGPLALIGVLSVLAAVRFVPTGHSGDSSGVGAGERLSVMTLNYPSWYVHDGDRATQLLRLMNRYRPDVVALQEVWVNYNANGTVRNSVRDISVISDSASYVTRGPVGDRENVSHAPVYSLFPFDQINLFEVPFDPSGKYAARVTRAEGSWRQRSLVVYGVHMQSFGSDKPWQEDNSSLLNPRVWLRYLRQYRDAIRRRASQAEQLAKMIQEETDPVIVMGDFNSTSHNWDFAWVSEGLTDAFSVAGVGWGATYHARKPFARIDFVLVSDEFEVLSAEVPNVTISDHRPVVAAVSWREEAPDTP